MADPSSPIDALRERVATELAIHYVVEDNAFPLCCSCGKDFAGYIAWRRHVADAMLDALGLEQVGWKGGRAEGRGILPLLWCDARQAAEHGLVPVFAPSPGKETG